MSDIDLIVVCKDLPKDHWKRQEKVKPIMEKASAYIEPLWWTPKEMETHVKNKFYLILDALDEGKILYDPDNFLHKLRK